ncbi:MAG: phenylalanine--tRNA ligase subunit alpha, partial [Paludibacteraceae bacterium]|nr:phenylalanine--tRNA ligase subunit alpha [Paludibacteraceae bacterium]
MKDRILQLQEEISHLTAQTLEEVEALRIKYLSKKGEISQLFNDFRNVSNEEKREIGQLLNELKNNAHDQINQLKEKLEANRGNVEKIDLTRTAEPIQIGTRHPLSIVRNEIATIFSGIGFTIA